MPNEKSTFQPRYTFAQAQYIEQLVLDDLPLLKHWATMGRYHAGESHKRDYKVAMAALKATRASLYRRTPIRQ